MHVPPVAFNPVGPRAGVAGHGVHQTLVLPLGGGTQEKVAGHPLMALRGRQRHWASLGAQGQGSLTQEGLPPFGGAGRPPE